MKAMLRILFPLLITSLLILSCHDRPVTIDDALSCLDSLEMKLDWLDYRIGGESWQLYTTGKADSLDFYRDLYHFVVSDKKTYDLIYQSKHLFKNELDKRRWELAYSTMLLSRVESRDDITRLRDSLTKLDINYRAEFEGQKQTAQYLYRLYRTAPDRSRRERAYRAWCAVGLELADGSGQLFRLRNQEARRFGYNNYLAMVFDREGLDINDYLKLLNVLDSLSISRYEEILQKSKNNLGYEDLEIWDLAYAYVDIRENVDRYFPADSQMSYVKRGLDNIGFNLDKLPVYFDLESREGKSQLAYAFPINPPHDLRVLANLTDCLYSTRILLHEIGHALHFAHIAQEQPFFVNNQSGSWSEGMAQIIAALCDQKKWLKTYTGMPDGLIENHLKSRQEQDLIYLRTTLMRLYFEYEAYANPNRDLNEIYWDLFEKFMMLPRHDDIKPWAAIIHYTTHPVYLHHYLLADIITAQTIAYFEKNYDTIVDNPTFGSFLVQNYFRFGSRYDWREMLERGTGERLNPAYLIEKLKI